jgi:YHS domain-containing protein
MADYKNELEAEREFRSYVDNGYRSEQIGKANRSKRRSNSFRDLFILFIAALFVLAIASVSFACDEDADTAAKANTATAAPKVFDTAQAVGTQVTCPVMGTVFAIEKDTIHKEYKGKHVYLCCQGCIKKFKADPGKYTK